MDGCKCEYDVRAEDVDALLDAYGANGAWAQLFGRTPGYGRTRLFREVDVADRFLTVDRWADLASWEAFLRQRDGEYRELDQRLGKLAGAAR